MARDSIDITDASVNQTNSPTSKAKTNRGCYISLPVGVALVLLAILIAAAVGLIVHFVGGSRDVTCTCKSPWTFPDNSTAQQITQVCMALASTGHPEICRFCTAPSATVTAATSTLASGTTTASRPPNNTYLRLPTSVHPLHYDIEIQPYMHDPDPQRFTFRGSVKILVSCNSTTDNITLHVDVLTVDPSSIRVYPETSPAPGDPQYASFQEDPEKQFFIVRLDKNLEIGKKYWIEMNFTSPLTNKTIGFYYSKYKRDTDNQTIYLATTQFEATYARQAFPCFDEPAMKATFTMTLVRPADRISLSNMPIANSNTRFQEDGITYVKDVYLQTVHMSTYTLAFVVCDYLSLSKTTKYNVTLTTWAKPQSVNDTRYALDVGVNITEYFEDYFDFRYPLPKQDMIAIPDMMAGAMENWGLITYHESIMLYTEGVSDQATKKLVVLIVSHELAHQWFGNLVTMTWWDDAFLNEGFANFVSYLGVDNVHPDWRMLDVYTSEELQQVLRVDGRVSSHPVYVPVQKPDEIKKFFDNIIYQKGGSLLRMMRMFVGEDTFQRAIRNYLKEFSYRTASHDDLWSAMTEQVTSEGRYIDVKDIMDTWILQMNYPVVTVSRDFNNPAMIHVVQERFISDPAEKDPGTYQSPFNYSWSIPLTFTSSVASSFNQDHTAVQWMFKEERTKIFNGNIPLPDISDSDGWILANVQQYGFYRVNYQIGNWLALCRQMQKNVSVIPAVTRGQIISDAFNLAKAGYLQIEIACATLEYLHKERDYMPWKAALEEVTFVDSMLFNTTQYGAFKNFVKSKLTEPFNKLGLTNITHNPADALTQSLVATQACYYGVQSCLNKVNRLYRLWVTSPSHNPIDPNIREMVFCNVIANGGMDELEFALNVTKHSGGTSETNSILSAMACSTQPEILRRYWQLILDQDSRTLQNDKVAKFILAQNRFGKNLIWKFVVNNYDVMKSWFRYLVSAFAAKTFTDFSSVYFQLKQVIGLHQSDRELFGSNLQALDQANETIQSNIRRRDTHMPGMATWLKDK